MASEQAKVKKSPSLAVAAQFHSPFSRATLQLGILDPGNVVRPTAAETRLLAEEDRSHESHLTLL